MEFNRCQITIFLIFILELLSMSWRNCKNSPDHFCYICGKYTLTSQRRNMTTQIQHAYHCDFGCKIGDQDKIWAPHICCVSCQSSLSQWLNGKKNSMSFAVPMIWREPKNHTDDCYFCQVNISGHSKKSKSTIAYRDCLSALKRVPHD